jgi:hypothetical protein
MTDQTIKRIVEVFHEVEVETKEISAELKKTSAHAKKVFEHLTEDAVALLVWDLLPVRKRPARSTVKEILKALTRIDEYSNKDKP